MPKIVFVALFFCVSFLLSAQIDSDNGKVQVLAYWTKGEVAEYLVTHEKSELDGEKTTLLGTSTFHVKVEIVDETSNSYKLKWTYSDIEVPGADDLTKTLVSLVDGLTLVLTTDENGIFAGLDNWQEVSQRLSQAIDLMVQKFLNVKEVVTVSKNLKALYSTKASIEGLAIKDVLQYLKYYGTVFEIDKQYISDLQVESPFGGKPIPAETVGGVDSSDVDETNDSFIVRQWTTFDSTSAKNAIIGLLSKVTNDSVTPNADVGTLGDVLVQDRDTAQFVGESGWLYTSIYTREITYSGKRRLDRTTIEMQ